MLELATIRYLQNTIISFEYVDFWPKIYLLLCPSFGNLTSQIDKMVGLDTLWQAWECTRALHQTALDLMPKSHYCIYCDGKLILCILYCAVNWINGSLINDIHYKSEEASKLKCNLFQWTKSITFLFHISFASIH